MTVLSMSVRADGEWQLVHQCRSCGELGVNRIAGDDNPLALLRVAMRPLTDPTRPIPALCAPRVPGPWAGLDLSVG
jgi:hypothetical protein